MRRWTRARSANSRLGPLRAFSNRILALADFGSWRGGRGSSNCLSCSSTAGSTNTRGGPDLAVFEGKSFFFRSLGLLSAAPIRPALRLPVFSGWLTARSLAKLFPVVNRMPFGGPGAIIRGDFMALHRSWTDGWGFPLDTSLSVGNWTVLGPVL